jgi:hypothetical protein
MFMSVSRSSFMTCLKPPSLARTGPSGWSAAHQANPARERKSKKK